MYENSIIQAVIIKILDFVYFYALMELCRGTMCAYLQMKLGEDKYLYNTIQDFL